MGIIREPNIASNVLIQSLVENHVLGLGQASFIITINGSPAGVVTLPDIAAVPREEWSRRNAGDLMTPLHDLPSVAPDDDLLAAVQLMSANDLLFLPVFENGRMAGLLTRDEVMRYVAQHPAAT